MESFIYRDLGVIDYEEALDCQQKAFNELLKEKAQDRKGENCLFFCEHQPVLTIGKSGKDSNLLIPETLLAGSLSTMFSEEVILPIMVPDKLPVIQCLIWIAGSWD